MAKTYNDVVEIAYSKSEFKNIISIETYKMLSMLYMQFIYNVLSNKLLKRVRFPGLCLFYPSTKNINKAILKLSTMDGKEQRIIELNNILNNLNKNGKNTQKKIR